MRMTLRTIESIESTARRLRREYGTSDPIELARDMDCMIEDVEFGELAGFCMNMLGVNVIGLNANMDEYTRRCACAHELGHIVLGHVRQAGFTGKHRADLTDLTARFEAEANCFAASLLMSDEDTLDAIRTYGEAERAAASMYVCTELFGAKLRILNAKGCRFDMSGMRSGRQWKRCVNADYEA